MWNTGKLRNSPEVDLETWFIPGGCARAALYTFLQPRIYAYVMPIMRRSGPRRLVSLVGAGVSDLIHAPSLSRSLVLTLMGLAAPDARARKVLDAVAGIRDVLDGTSMTLQRTA